MELIDEGSRESMTSEDGIIQDLQTVIREFPHGDEHPQRIPVKSLSDEFDSVGVAELMAASTNNSGGANMRVYLRVRPVLEGGGESTIRVTSSASLCTLLPEVSKRSVYAKVDERHYSFTQVLGETATQEEVFEAVGNPMLDRFLAGESCVLLAYGMTNAGKTHTIQGAPKDPGLFPRLVSSVLAAAKKSSTTPSPLQVRLTMLEIYQDKVFDLLSYRRENLHIRDNGGQVEVGKLSSHAVCSAEEARELLEAAAVRRSKSHTLLNAGSSRSHAIYSITLCAAATTATSTITGVHSEDQQGQPQSQQGHSLHVVDLAGAERGNRTKSSIAQQREANNINTSLMQLWRCLNAMKRRNADANMIPFRECKLTHILMPHLGRAGLSGVAMLTCVNPASEDYDETVSILGNASLACKIREILDVRGPNNSSSQQQQEQRMSATALERAAERASNKDKAAALGEARKRRVETSGFVPPAKFAREGAKAAASKRASDIATAAAVTAIVTAPAVVDTTAGTETRELLALRAEVVSLRGENALLRGGHLEREQAVRLEVAEEMAARSAHLLAQMEQLQSQLEALRGEREGGGGLLDINKSCKKARRAQRVLAGAGAGREALDVEEEMESLKQKHEGELFLLKTERRQLEMEAAGWREKAEAATRELERVKATVLAAVPTVLVPAAAESELGMRTLRDARGRPAGQPPVSRKSPVMVRGPLANKTNSPIRLDELAVLAKPTPPTLSGFAGASTGVENDENAGAKQFSPYMQRLRSNYANRV